MKKLKKVWIWLCVALLLFCMVSCKEEEKGGTGSITLVLGEQEYTLALKEEKNFLNLLTENGISYQVQGSGEYAFLTAVGDMQQNEGEGRYLYLYTSAQEDFDVSVYATEKEYKGTRLVSSGVGVNRLHLYDGVVIVIDYIVW